MAGLHLISIINQLRGYKQQRLREMQEIAKREIYGRVVEFSKSDYEVQVTQASKECYVVVFCRF
jgi:hypothetical protein